MEGGHQQRACLVGNGHDACDDRGAAEGEERRGEPHQLIARLHLREAGVARREDAERGRLVERLEVVDRQRSVGEVDRREERVVRTERSVRREVRDVRAVQGGQHRLRRRCLGEERRHPVQRAHRVGFDGGEWQSRPCRNRHTLAPDTAGTRLGFGPGSRGRRDDERAPGQARQDRPRHRVQHAGGDEDQ